MNVLRNQIGRIDTVTRAFITVARALKEEVTDAFFEDKICVCIENVEAAFEIEKEAKDASTEVHSMVEKIVAESPDSVRLIYLLKNKIKEIESKIDAIEKILEIL